MTAAAGRAIDVWHDENGRIVAWGYRPAGAPDYLRAVPVAAPGRAVLSLTVAEEQLASLHQTHVVDVVKASLRSRSDQD